SVLELGRTLIGGGGKIPWQVNSSVAFILNLFTPDTWEAFQRNGAEVSGFKLRQRNAAESDVKPGDIFVCYLVRLSRWCGALEVISSVYEDDSPIFSDPDPFVLRFKVRPIVLLKPEAAIPIFEDEVWRTLSSTQSFEPGTSGWTGQFRSSLRRLNKADGEFLLQRLRAQAAKPQEYPFTDRDRRQLARKSTVRGLDREVAVEVPDNADNESKAPSVLRVASEEPDERISITMQARLAEIGAKMEFNVWVPRNDRARVCEHLTVEARRTLIDTLPLNYDDVTLRTIENIDVLWLKRRSIARAFEVEHTTAVYSGILRMADLLALQPNMDIRLHIVAPSDKREKVFREIKRPVFSLLERGPLYEYCTYLPYEAVSAIADTPHLSHMNDSLLEEYAEHAEDAYDPLL
ncbi:hypothetical protein, partial [Paracoccus niistensis]